MAFNNTGVGQTLNDTSPWAIFIILIIGLIIIVVLIVLIIWNLKLRKIRKNIPDDVNGDKNERGNKNEIRKLKRRIRDGEKELSRLGDGEPELEEDDDNGEIPRESEARRTLPKLPHPRPRRDERKSKRDGRNRKEDWPDFG